MTEQDCVNAVKILNASKGMQPPIAYLNGAVVNKILKTDKYRSDRAYVVTKGEIREVVE